MISQPGPRHDRTVLMIDEIFLELTQSIRYKH